MAPSLTAAFVLLACSPVPAAVSAFSGPTTRPTRRARTRRPSVRDTDGDDFDPFLISPLTVGEEDGDGGGEGASAEGGSVIEALESLIQPPEPVATSGSAAAADFDPLLSPHAYAGGADAGPAAPAAPGSAGESSDFDPLLSPHAYADGADAGPTDSTDRRHVPGEERVGILLIDHGSRRPASNEHIHNVATVYEGSLRRDASAKVVRAAHMEIAEPGILVALRDLITHCRATRVVCVPYFLSPGRHSTEDVPRLISEARDALKGEGIEAEVVISNALGTAMPQMLGAIDVLVDGALVK